MGVMQQTDHLCVLLNPGEGCAHKSSMKLIGAFAYFQGKEVSWPRCLRCVQRAQGEKQADRVGLMLTVPMIGGPAWTLHVYLCFGCFPSLHRPAAQILKRSQDGVSSHHGCQRFGFMAQIMPPRGKFWWELTVVSSPSKCFCLVGGFAGFIAGLLFSWLLKGFLLWKLFTRGIRTVGRITGLSGYWEGYWGSLSSSCQAFEFLGWDIPR